MVGRNKRLELLLEWDGEELEDEDPAKILSSGGHAVCIQYTSMMSCESVSKSSRDYALQDRGSKTKRSGVSHHYSKVARNAKATSIKKLFSRSDTARL